MKVLLISHTCASVAAGLPKAEWLAADHGVEMMVVVPDRWRDYGDWRRTPELAGEGNGVRPNARGKLNYRVCTVRWPWVGPAQSYLHWYPDLRRILREFRPDIIDLWEEPWSLVSAHACWLRNRLLPSSAVISETEQNVEKTLPFPFEHFRKFTLRNASYLIGRSTEATAVAVRKGYSGPMAVVPNGVDETLFRPLDRAACRRQFGMRGFTAGYVGRLVEEKGLLDFVDALARCPSRVEGVLVGDGPMRDMLYKTISDQGLSTRVKLLGALGPGKLPELMNALDVLVLPSKTTRRWKEQFGRVIIEAHACGIPVIGSDSGAIPEVVGGGGRIVPEGNPESLAAALESLADNPAQAVEWSRAGRSKALQMCTWRAVARQMHGIYQTVLA